MLRMFKPKLFRRSAFVFFTVLLMTSLYGSSLAFAASSAFSTSTTHEAQLAGSQIKLHDLDVSFDDTRPEPHVCRFFIEGNGYGTGQGGTWLISGQNPTPGNVTETGNWATDADGNWHTEAIAGLANGRYRLDVVNSAGGTTSKFFWVDCALPGGAVANISSNVACPQGADIIKDHSVITMSLQGKAFIEFTLAPGCFDVALSLVSYMAPNANFSRETANQQVLYAATTGTFSSDAPSFGRHIIEVAMPSCYWQVNFVFGQPIVNLGPAASSNFYQDQGRLIAGSEGGFTSCSGISAPAQPIPTGPIPPIGGVPSTGGSASTTSSWTFVLAMVAGGLGFTVLGISMRGNRKSRG